ncbi:hypothetical protein JTE90_016532 [Oedothorax gibbosus]|uniref:Uncharacterized protein n=1 Tax=Oedothorax gibbosus TaxID=931172 RepID=A0AAV6UWX5_9ARAC|nr:hypothetical protein JTE90_016532 [Oedothorax gibbosus]
MTTRNDVHWDSPIKQCAPSHDAEDKRDALEDAVGERCDGEQMRRDEEEERMLSHITHVIPQRHLPVGGGFGFFSAIYHGMEKMFFINFSVVLNICDT